MSCMIDMHCHLLPGVDDGPQTMEEALEVARLAVADGISYALMTPHVIPGQYNNRRKMIHRATQRLRAALTEAQIPLRIGVGAEVRMDLKIVEMLGREQIPFVGERDGCSILLLELPEDHIPIGAPRFIERLLKQKIRPMLAHPERNQAIATDLDALRPLTDLGCYLQVSAGSLLGEFGRAARRRARQILGLDALTVIASDTHDTRLRRPNLTRARIAAEAIVGKERAEHMLSRIPSQIVFGRRLPARKLDRRRLAAKGFRFRVVREKDSSGFVARTPSA